MMIYSSRAACRSPGIAPVARQIAVPSRPLIRFPVARCWAAWNGTRFLPRKHVIGIGTPWHNSLAVTLVDLFMASRYCIATRGHPLPIK
ncbi:hypothetical protein VTI28DRAFT_6176 [Corynascus sepedonium]